MWVAGPAVAWVDGGDRIVMMRLDHVGEPGSPEPGPRALETSAAVIWRAVLTASDPDELVALVSRNSPANPPAKAIRADVLGFVDQLLADGWLAAR